jgi:hypothetical protein
VVINLFAITSEFAVAALYACSPVLAVLIMLLIVTREGLSKEVQNELAALSSGSTHRVVEGATHESLLYDKHDSRVTSAAIEQVVQAVRTDRPLTR